MGFETDLLGRYKGGSEERDNEKFPYSCYGEEYGKVFILIVIKLMLILLNLVFRNNELQIPNSKYRTLNTELGV